MAFQAIYIAIEMRGKDSKPVIQIADCALLLLNY
jgi:hypothetical protein